MFYNAFYSFDGSRKISPGKTSHLENSHPSNSPLETPPPVGEGRGEGRGMGRGVGSGWGGGVYMKILPGRNIFKSPEWFNVFTLEKIKILSIN